MPAVKLSKESRQRAASSLSTYLKAELDVEVSGFDAEFLLDFIAERLGPHFYNQGLRDAQAILRKKLDLITEAVDELEIAVKPS